MQKEINQNYIDRKRKIEDNMRIQFTALRITEPKSKGE